MAIELLNQRSYTRKVFDLGGGQKRYNFHLGNIHYPDSNNVLQDIDTTFMFKAGGRYQDKHFFACEIPDVVTGDFTYFNKDHSFDLKLIGVKPLGYSLQTPASSALQPIPDIWGDMGKGFRYPDVFGAGIHFEVVAMNSKFEKRLRVDAPPPVTNVPIGIVFEILKKPDVFEVGDETSLQPLDINLDESSAPALENRIWRIRSSIGQRISYIRRPFCYDSNPIRQKKLPVKIKFHRTAGGRFFLVKIIPPEIWQNAVYPVFADDPVSYYQGAGDGFSEYGYYAWNTTHDAASGNWTDYTSTINDVGSYESGVDTNVYKCFRAFIPVDTSGIPDGDTITDAVQYINTNSITNNDNDGDDWINIVQTSQASPTSLANADYDQCGAIDNPTEGATRIDFGSLASAGNYTAFTLNATGRGWIDKTGYTYLGMREGHDALDIPVDILTGTYTGNRLQWRNSEYTGTGSDPYLDVTSSAGGGGGFSAPFIID